MITLSKIEPAIDVLAERQLCAGDVVHRQRWAGNASDPWPACMENVERPARWPYRVYQKAIADVRGAVLCWDPKCFPQEE